MTKVNINMHTAIKPTPHHKIGNWYVRNETTDLYFLTRTGKWPCSTVLTNVRLGVHWSDAVEVSNFHDITQKEFDLLTCSYDFTLVNQITISLE